MPKGKCRACGEVVDTETAYAVMVNKRRSFYCNEAEYHEYQKDKRSIQKVAGTSQQQIDKDKVYWLICDIIGRKEIINTALWKERAIWKTIASDETIARYLHANKDYLINVISKLDDVEFSRIRYLSAIIKNNLGDFKQNTQKTEKPKTQVDETFYGTETTKQNKRRSLADLEDEF